MGNTSGKIIILIGLAALALSACGGDDRPSDAWTTGAGGGGQGGAEPTPEVEVFWCSEIAPDTADHVINGMLDSKDHGYFDPAELTVKPGDVVQFHPYDSVQNMESGVNEVKDGKFHLQQGVGGCLRFNVPGTYPFFSLGAFYPMSGTVYVE